jgi:hypothetical protein
MLQGDGHLFTAQASGLLPLLGMGNVQAFCPCYRGMGNCSLLRLMGLVMYRLLSTVTGGWATVHCSGLLPLLGMGNVQAFIHCYRRMGN